MHETSPDARGSHEPLSIGELATASGLSAKALRLYDESGLLPPRAVDPVTGYRSYGTDQVPRARLIAALRGVGMGLARIAIVCDLPSDAAASEIRSWWRQERADAISRDGAVLQLLTDLGSTRKAPVMTSIDPTGSPRIASAAARADIGTTRPAQQDAALERPLPGGRRMLGVADGFGEDALLAQETLGIVSGALVSALAAGDDLSGALDRAWHEAEALVAARPGGELGTTLTVAAIEGERLVLAHIGDTRAYLVRGGRIEIVTQDHTHVRSLVAAGRLTADEAASHPDRATLNRALAPGAPTAPDLLVRHVMAGDRVLLLSDGVHAVVPAAGLAPVLTAPGSAEEVADALVGLALAAGAPDNIAVAVAELA